MDEDLCPACWHGNGHLILFRSWWSWFMRRGRDGELSCGDLDPVAGGPCLCTDRFHQVLEVRP